MCNGKEQYKAYCVRYNSKYYSPDYRNQGLFFYCAPVVGGRRFHSPCNLFITGFHASENPDINADMNQNSADAAEKPVKVIVENKEHCCINVFNSSNAENIYKYGFTEAQLCFCYFRKNIKERKKHCRIKQNKKNVASDSVCEKEGISLHGKQVPQNYINNGSGKCSYCGKALAAVGEIVIDFSEQKNISLSFL